MNEIELITEALWDEIRHLADVIVEFLASTNGVKLSEKELLAVEIGINAGITAALEYLQAEGWINP